MFAGLFGNKFALYGLLGLIIVTFITASVGGFWLTQNNLIDGYKKQIEQRDKTINQLKAELKQAQTDKELAIASNESLQLALDKRTKDMVEAARALERLEQLDEDSRNRILALEKEITSSEQRDKLERIRQSRKATLLLRKTNSFWDCWVENFDKSDGKCIVGKFVKDGERVVPKEGE